MYNNSLVPIMYKNKPVFVRVCLCLFVCVHKLCYIFQIPYDLPHSKWLIGPPSLVFLFSRHP